MPAYTLQLVQCNNFTASAYNVGLGGFPSGSFNHFLLSMWVCLGPYPNTRIVSFVNTIVWGTVSIDAGKVRVWFRPGQSTPISFDGYFGVVPANVITHVLVSLSPVAGHVQVYANDVPLTLTSGGWTGNPVGSFNLAGFSQWEVDAAGSSAPGPGAADVFAAAPASFYDLSVTANRRKFINSNLTPVDLGTDASSVLGSPPPVYLTARSGVAADFANNNGTGGAWTVFTAYPLVFLAPGSCVAPTLPATLAMDDVVCTSAAPGIHCRIFLDWSDNRGRSFGNPIGQSLNSRGYLTSLQWQRLAYARDRVFRLTWSCPQSTVLQGAWVEAEPADNEE